MSKNRTVKLDSAQGYTYTPDISNDKAIDRLIKNIENIVRSSPEYRDYIKFLKENLDMDKCAFFQNVSSHNSKIKIEIHHEPLTLYDIVQTVLNKYMSNCEAFDDYIVAEEVMNLHYQGMVGLIPLSVTVHEMVHASDKIKIPLHLIYGEYIKFINEYEDYIDDKVLDKLDKKIADTKLLSEKSFEALNINFSYLDVDGFKLPTFIDGENNETSEESKTVDEVELRAS
jgi:hypothetical protein